MLQEIVQPLRSTKWKTQTKTNQKKEKPWTLDLEGRTPPFRRLTCYFFLHHRHSVARLRLSFVCWHFWDCWMRHRPLPPVIKSLCGRPSETWSGWRVPMLRRDDVRFTLSQIVLGSPSNLHFSARLKLLFLPLAKCFHCSAHSCKIFEFFESYIFLDESKQTLWSEATLNRDQCFFAYLLVLGDHVSLTPSRLPSWSFFFVCSSSTQFSTRSNVFFWYGHDTSWSLVFREALSVLSRFHLVCVVSVHTMRNGMYRRKVQFCMLILGNLCVEQIYSRNTSSSLGKDGGVLVGGWWDLLGRWCCFVRSANHEHGSKRSRLPLESAEQTYVNRVAIGVWRAVAFPLSVGNLAFSIPWIGLCEARWTYGERLRSLHLRVLRTHAGFRSSTYDLPLLVIEVALCHFCEVERQVSKTRRNIG